MKNVYCIESTRLEGARPLYEAAAKIFEIPGYDDLQSWLAGGPAPTLQEQLSPHTGPSVALLTSVWGTEAALITTNGGRRVWVSDKQTAIEFPLPGSVIAAGEIVRHAWNVPMDSWAQAIMTDGAVVDLDDYPGLVGCNMYLARSGVSRERMLEFAQLYRWSIGGKPVTADNLGDFLGSARS